MAERVLTVKQPWADLIMAGVNVENRTWTVPSTLPCTRGGEHRTGTTYACTPFPFRLWIHAAKEADEQALRDLPKRDPSGRSRIYHYGALLGSVTVTGCHHVDECRQWSARGTWSDTHPQWTYCSPWAQPGAYHWTLADPQPLAEPIPMRGRQRLWTLPADAEVPA